MPVSDNIILALTEVREQINDMIVFSVEDDEIAEELKEIHNKITIILSELDKE